MQQSTLVNTAYWDNILLAAAINPALAAPTVLSAAKMMLGVAAITPNLRTVYADLSEATFTGYAQSATIVWGALVNESDGSPSSEAPSHLFRCTAGGTPNSIQSFGITDGVVAPGTGIIASAAIAPPIPIVNAGDGFSALPSMNIGPTPAFNTVIFV